MTTTLCSTSEVTDFLSKGEPRSPSRVYAKGVTRDMEVCRVSPNIRHALVLKDGERGIRVNRIGPSLTDILSKVQRLEDFAATSTNTLKSQGQEISDLQLDLKNSKLDLKNTMLDLKSTKAELDKLSMLVTLREIWNSYKKTTTGQDIESRLLAQVKVLYDKRPGVTSKSWKMGAYRKYLSDEVSMLRSYVKIARSKLENPTTHPKSKATQRIFKKSVEDCLNICEGVVVSCPEWQAYGAQVWKLMEVGDDGNLVLHDIGVSASDVISRADSHLFIVDEIDLADAVKSLLKFLPQFGKDKYT